MIDEHKPSKELSVTNKKKEVTNETYKFQVIAQKVSTETARTRLGASLQGQANKQLKRADKQQSP
jgi:hypothetical protein